MASFQRNAYKRDEKDLFLDWEMQANLNLNLKKPELWQNIEQKRQAEFPLCLLTLFWQASVFLKNGRIVTTSVFLKWHFYLFTTKFVSLPAGRFLKTWQGNIFFPLFTFKTFTELWTLLKPNSWLKYERKLFLWIDKYTKCKRENVVSNWLAKIIIRKEILVKTGIFSVTPRIANIVARHPINKGRTAKMYQVLTLSKLCTTLNSSVSSLHVKKWRGYGKWLQRNSLIWKDWKTNDIAIVTFCRKCFY